MPITINGSGTVTGISAGGLPDGVITTDEIAANAVTLGKIGTTEQGQLCKAWVNFDGTGTPAIRASFNVSSITDNGVGSYTINFTNALQDANYSMVQTSSDISWGSRNYIGALTSVGAGIVTISGNSNVQADVGIICVSFFR
jgi:hypothetical protein